MEPGPGAYGAPDIKKVRKGSPSWKMGTSKRTDDSMNHSLKVPGPGAYEPKVRVFFYFFQFFKRAAHHLLEYMEPQEKKNR